MPQGQPMDEKLPSGQTVNQAVAGASTTSKTVNKTVPTEVTEAFKGFLNSVFGQSPATPVPGTGGASTASTPAVVGGLPPNMVTPPSPISTPPPVPLAPPSGQTPLQTAPRGTQFGSPGAAASSAMGDLTNTLVGAIENNRNKKDEDNIARAQNTMNIFMHALSQNDMRVANLYASDPKITGMWEKYLKQEYKRVPGKAQGSEATPAANLAAGVVPTQPTPLPPGVQGNVNEPGGIAIPRDMTPEGQIHAKQMQAIQQTMSGMSPQQIAATASQPGVNMEQAGLTPEEFKRTSLMKYGIALTAAEDKQYDTASKIAMANTMSDVLKYAVGQQATTERAMIAAGATTKAAQLAADSRIQVMRDHIKGLKEIQGMKGTAFTTALTQQIMKTYGQLADDINKKLADPKYGVGWFSDSDRKMLEAQRDDYIKKAADAQQSYEGMKLINDLFPELGEQATPPAETKPEAEAP